MTFRAYVSQSVQYVQPGHCSVGIGGCLSDYKAILLCKIPVRHIEAHCRCGLFLVYHDPRLLTSDDC